MTNEEKIAQLASMSSEEITDGLLAFAKAVEEFRRSMLVGDLFASWHRAYRGDQRDGVTVVVAKLRDTAPDFLEDLEEFGAWLKTQGRAERSKAEVRRTGSGYSRGA
jgi:hypothetical protein